MNVQQCTTACSLSGASAVVACCCGPDRQRLTMRCGRIRRRGGAHVGPREFPQYDTHAQQMTDRKRSSSCLLRERHSSTIGTRFE